ncbi:MAG: glycosyltransferase [Muribaculaceae bacterium]|nr:glycosyltransferase [Muribaculaceae bacterium]
MLFSIITVTYNAEKELLPTMESVREQTLTDYEHLVVDGASGDGTVRLAEEMATERTRIVSERDGGLYDAMNKGIGLAQGDYLIFLNAGDTFSSKDALSRMAAAAATGADVIYGQTQVVDAERKVVGARHLTAPERLSADSFKRGMLVCHQAFVARRAIVPDYDLQYRFSADYDWCVKVLKRARRCEYVGSAPVVDFLEGGTTAKNKRKSLWERYRIMCRHYGTITATLHHLSFIPRALRRHLSSR